MLRTDLLTFGVAATVFGIAGGMCRLLAYFDNPADIQIPLQLCFPLLKLDESLPVMSLKNVIPNLVINFLMSFHCLHGSGRKIASLYITVIC